MKTEFVIDADKWRCGGKARDPKKKLGRGETLLLNKSGFMCCLGQCLLQEDETLEILNIDVPCNLDEKCVRNNFVENGYGTGMRNTNLSCSAMQINDNIKITISERVSKLKELFKEHGLKLKFKNIKKYL